MGALHKRTAAPGLGGGSGNVEAACVDASRDTEAHSKNQLITDFAEARDRVEVWIALLNLLDRLRARVGDAVDDYESELLYDEALVAELTQEVETFSRYAAHLRRRRRP